MSEESHRKYLESVARREAQKAVAKNPGLSRDRLRRLKVQTIEPWKRVSAGVFSLGVAATGVWLTSAADQAWGGWLIVAGILGLLFSVLGWKRTLDGLSNAIDVGDILDALF